VTEQQKTVDRLLAVGAARMLLSGEMMQQMRILAAAATDGPDERYWRLANQLAEHLAVGGHCLTESHRILLAEMGITLTGAAAGGWKN
jgi:hypothetical protein